MNRDHMRSVFGIVYPETGSRTGEQLVGYARDYLATEYMAANPGADEAAIEENSRVGSVLEAIQILDDAGRFTFVRGTFDFAESGQ